MYDCIALLSQVCVNKATFRITSASRLGSGKYIHFSVLLYIRKCQRTSSEYTIIGDEHGRTCRLFTVRVAANSRSLSATVAQLI